MFEDAASSAFLVVILRITTKKERIRYFIIFPSFRYESSNYSGQLANMFYFVIIIPCSKLSYADVSQKRNAHERWLCVLKLKWVIDPTNRICGTLTSLPSCHTRRRFQFWGRMTENDGESSLVNNRSLVSNFRILLSVFPWLPLRAYDRITAIRQVTFFWQKIFVVSMLKPV